ncbi:hypothetical protein [Streptomyces sp. NPDC050848]|uniref:hypothetical protein n=1 Tax=Streptomyces sp. NPDC050848 TaxID=3155791 RepID=UPI003403464F
MRRPRPRRRRERGAPGLESLDEKERQAFRTLLGRIACDVRGMDLTAALCDARFAPCDAADPAS